MRIDRTPPCKNISNDAISAQAATRASIPPMTPLKWRFVRAFEAAVQLASSLLPSMSPMDGSNRRPDRILVIEYWNLGDLAILVPFLRNLRRSFPTARVSLLINPNLSSFLEGQGMVDEFIPIRVPWARHFNRWRKYNPFSTDWISLATTIMALRK